MYIKGTRFYADWTDKDGHRRRKAFTTAKGALAHQSAQRALLSKRKRRIQSAQSSGASSLADRKTTPQPKPRAQSLPTLVKPTPKTSAPPKPTKSTRPFARVVTLTRRG
ncbi:MAG TPA: hypothetical protein VFC37_22270 [Terracidiphilus sp.]|nr:hypothetical protein [Terracidiphilus sp.]